MEGAIEPELPICDAHHHLWYYPDSRYLAKELLYDISGGHNVLLTLFVEAWGLNQQKEVKMKQPAEETQFVITESKRVESRTYIAAGIIGYADLMQGDGVIPVLESHIAAAENRFRGIRLARESVLDDKKFREGMSALAKYGLSLDVFIPWQQLLELVDLARAFSDIPMIVNHLGGPVGTGPNDKNHEYAFQEWGKRVSLLATCENVFMKLGGMGMSIFGFGWHEQSIPPSSAELSSAIAPYCLHCIDKFGADRCMFESNFPVDRSSYSYTVLWNAFKLLSESFSYNERCSLFHDTAVNVYRLGHQSSP